LTVAFGNTWSNTPICITEALLSNFSTYNVTSTTAFGPVTSITGINAGGRVNVICRGR
jgi:hypothetical protein